MRLSIKPKGKPLAARGSVTKYDVTTGQFTVVFDVPLSGVLPDGTSTTVKELGFMPDQPLTQPVNPLAISGPVTDGTFGLSWDILHQ